MTAHRMLAGKIRTQLGGRIDAAVVATERKLVSAAFLAGLVSVENAKLNPLATRFELGVFDRLKLVRDSKLPRTYKGIHKSQIIRASDAALRALATSYSFTQIMGWHVLVAPLAGQSIADLRDADHHLLYAVQLLEHDAKRHLKAKNYPAVLRIWNTGRPNGKTHDPQYVQNALAVMDAYRNG